MPGGSRAPGASPVPRFQVGQLPTSGARGERGQPVAIRVGESELGIGMGMFGADDDPHPLRLAGQREHPDQLGHPRPVPRLPVGVVQYASSPDVTRLC